MVLWLIYGIVAIIVLILAPSTYVTIVDPMTVHSSNLIYVLVILQFGFSNIALMLLWHAYFADVLGVYKTMADVYSNVGKSLPFRHPKSTLLLIPPF